MYIFYLDPAEEFVQPNDPIHQLFEYADDMCILCTDAVVCPSYSGSYDEFEGHWFWCHQLNK